jgi:hypothetical protein
LMIKKYLTRNSGKNLWQLLAFMWFSL